jgi:hypothetical protein
VDLSPDWFCQSGFFFDQFFDDLWVFWAGSGLDMMQA